MTDDKFHKDAKEFVHSFPKVVANINPADVCKIAKQSCFG